MKTIFASIALLCFASLSSAQDCADGKCVKPVSLVKECQCGCVQTGSCACVNCNKHTADPSSPDFVNKKRFPKGVHVENDGSVHWKDAKLGKVYYDKATVDMFGDEVIKKIILEGYKEQKAVPRNVTPVFSAPNFSCPTCPR